MVQLFHGTPYKVVDIPAFGNCLFLSLSHQLFGTIDEDTGMKIRHEAATFVAENWDRFGPALSAANVLGAPTSITDAQSYKHYMSTSGVFGGEPELCAISEQYNVKLVVFFKHAPHCPPRTFNENSTRPIFLLYSGTLDTGHYKVLLPITDDGNTCMDVQYQCAICNMSFSQRETLEIHCQIHSSKTFCCDICSKSFSNANTLQ